MGSHPDLVYGGGEVRTALPVLDIAILYGQDTCKKLRIRKAVGAIGTSSERLPESFNATLKQGVLPNSKALMNELVRRRDVFASVAGKIRCVGIYSVIIFSGFESLNLVPRL